MEVKAQRSLHPGLNFFGSSGRACSIDVPFFFVLVAENFRSLATRFLDRCERKRKPRESFISPKQRPDLEVAEPCSESEISRVIILLSRAYVY